MAKREFLMLAHNFKADKHGISGWMLSEKLDGMRCFWDGGITRGMPKSEVPWANCDKDERYLEPPICSGLWSRYGNVIHAPDWWLDELPEMLLDGELYAGRENRQWLMSTIKQLVPDTDDWGKVGYYCFDTPPPEAVFADGHIKNTNFNKVFKGIGDWLSELDVDLTFIAKPDLRFASVYKVLQNNLNGSQVARAHKQHDLDYGFDVSVEQAGYYLHEFSAAGGEGCIVRDPDSSWIPERAHTIVKMKKTDDAEGTVVGYTSGRETDKGSKLLGLMGALVLQLENGERLELSGFTDEERKLAANNGVSCISAVEWAEEHPGEEVPDWIEAVYFPRGSKVTFMYRGLSNDGIPQEARYLRKHVVI